MQVSDLLVHEERMPPNTKEAAGLFNCSPQVF